MLSDSDINILSFLLIKPGVIDKIFTLKVNIPLMKKTLSGYWQKYVPKTIVNVIVKWR